MSTRHEKLLYTVGLIDKITGKAGRIGKTFDKLTGRVQAGMAGIAAGGAGLFSVGYAVKAILGPAVVMDRALGEVTSLGVREDAIKSLKNESLKFSIKYGEDAARIAASAYDIQSAIAGLRGNQLAVFTTQGALLAKATKSDSATITDYMGTMYSVFKTQADRMGKNNWVEQLTGKTAEAVKRFKTTGSEMSAAFSNVGSLATNRGVGIDEQLAILGTLQGSMSGSEAGTKYKAFLAKVGNAESVLGMNFSDTNGRMLALPKILEKIKSRFGDMDKTKDLDILAKAFGGKNGAAFVAEMSKDIVGLRKNIKGIQNIKDSSNAEEMAAAMADNWQRTDAAVKAARITFGDIMNKALIPFTNGVIRHVSALNSAMQRYPNITRVVGYLTLGVLTLTGVIALFSIGVGISKFLMVGWSVAMVGVNLVVWTYKKLMLGARIATLAFAISGWAAVLPLLAWVAGIALVGVAIYLLVKHFDVIKAKWHETINAINSSDFMIALFDGIGMGITFAIDKWHSFTSALSNLNPFKMLGKAFDWVMNKYNALPWVDKINLSDDSLLSDFSKGKENFKSAVQSGGLLQDITNATTQYAGFSVDTLNVNTTQPVTPWLIENEFNQAGG